MIADWLQRVIAYASKHDIHGGREYSHFYCRCVFCHRNFSNITAPTLSVMIALLLETLLAAIIVPPIFTIQRNVYNTYGNSQISSEENFLGLLLLNIAVQQ